jgi:putative membrane protein
MMTGFGWFSGLGMVFMWLFWIGLIALCIWLIVSIFPGTKSVSEQDSEATAIDILQRRYARGELTTDQYAVMRNDLDKK